MQSRKDEIRINMNPCEECNKLFCEKCLIDANLNMDIRIEKFLNFINNYNSDIYFEWFSGICKDCFYEICKKYNYKEN